MFEFDSIIVAFLHNAILRLEIMIFESFRKACNGHEVGNTNTFFLWNANYRVVQGRV